MKNFINLADIDKGELRKIINHAKSQKEKRVNLENFEQQQKILDK